jgi:hypothetical protein
MTLKDFIILILIGLVVYMFVKGPPQLTAVPPTNAYAIDTGAPATVTYPTAVPTDTAVPQPTFAPQPTYAPQPSVSEASPTAVPLVPDYNLPPMGPYSLQEIDLCEAIIQAGNLDTLPEPQRGLCEQYVAMRNK